MKIYERNKKRIIITSTFLYEDGLAVFYKEVGNKTQFYLYLPSGSNFDDFFIDTGQELGSDMKEYKTDFDCDQKEFETGAVRSDPAGKGRFDLIPYGPLKRVAQVYERGAAKHGERNWEQGFATSRGIDSAIRHIYQHAYGMDDEDHLAQAIWNLLAVMHFETLIEENKLPEDLDTLPKHYAKDDLDKYVEERTKRNPKFKAMAKAKGTCESSKFDADLLLERLPYRKIIKEEDFNFEEEEEKILNFVHQDVDSLTKDEIEEALKKGRKDSGYSQYPKGWRK